MSYTPRPGWEFQRVRLGATWAHPSNMFNGAKPVQYLEMNKFSNLEHV
jgi:hypothetical protein